MIIDFRPVVGHLSWALLSGFLMNSIAVSAQPVEIVYYYDDLNRLERFEREEGPVVVYAYDAAGNINTQAVSESPDMDGDGIADFADPDIDDDGMPNEWELQYGLNPYYPNDAHLDPDGDGLTNLQEYQLGTHPLQANGSGQQTAHQVPFLPVWGLPLLALGLGLIRLYWSQRTGTRA
jgi:hypothetical protein